MKLIETKDAIGYALCHDITQIVKGKVKDAVFRRGHVVTEEDLPILLSVGKDHIYVLEESDKDLMHEDDCAQYMIDLTIGENMSFTPVKEGKMELVSEIDGYLTVDVHLLYKINMLDDLMLASIQGNSVVKKGTKIAGMRIIPIFVKKSQMEELRDLIGDKKLFEIKPFVRKTAGIVTTGNEVYHKRIKDDFTPVVKEKLANYGVEVIGHETVYDDTEMIANAIRKLKDMGCELILCAGGMSVDPDDKTPYAIGQNASRVITYGAPVLPGAMFMLAYGGENENITFMGLPGCVMYEKKTIFDIVLPRIMAGEKVEKSDIDCLGVGGYCMHCPVCIFPNCSFGVS